MASGSSTQPNATQWTELVTVDEEGTRTCKRLKQELGDTPDALRTQKAGFTIRVISQDAWIYRITDLHANTIDQLRGLILFYNYYS